MKKILYFGNFKHSTKMDGRSCVLFSFTFAICVIFYVNSWSRFISFMNTYIISRKKIVFVPPIFFSVIRFRNNIVYFILFTTE